MNYLKPILDAFNNVTKIVPSAFKDHQEKLSSKRIFKLGGGGALLYTGIEFLYTAVETEGGNNSALIAGGICLALGSFLAIGLSEKIKNLTNFKNENK